MKMRTVSLVVWFAQLLIAWALYDNPRTTGGLEEVTTANPQLTTGTPATKKLGTTTTTTTTQTMKPPAIAETTVSPPAEEFLTKWTQHLMSTAQPSTARLHDNEQEALSSSPNSAGMENVSNAISTTHYKVMNLGQTVSSKPASLKEKSSENPETGTRSGVFTTGLKTEDLTSQDRVHTGHAMDINHWGSGTSLQTDHPVQTNSSQTTHENSTVQHINAVPSLTHDLDSEVTTGYIITTPKTAIVTQVMPDNGKYISMQNTEGPLVSSTSSDTVSPDIDTNQERAEWMENVTTTQRNMHNVTNTIWIDSLPTQRSEGSYSFTTEQQGHTTANDNTTQIELDTYVENQTTSGNSTVGYMKTEHGKHSQATTGHYITTNMTPVTSSDGKNISMENTERPLVTSTNANTVSAASSKESQEWKENVTKTQGTRTYTTRTYSRTRTETTDKHGNSVWSTSPAITLTSNSTEAVTTTNQSRQAEWAVWPDCFNKDSSTQTQQPSKVVCFIIMWSLGMIASIFLGLTIFLWARLSVVKKRAKRRGRKDRRGKRSARKERESLWVTDGVSADERVEFWYANGSTLEADKKQKGQEKENRTKRKGGKQKEENTEDMWIQPKVTLQDITEFWYANRRVRNEEGMERQREISGQ
ncbi:mucin-5AC isoform X1 [Pygocentrus nattereri]|uniref:mucin-5AC isoform X1 n=2 Tax=Pygocentrus nattereri TaxID=42514 RepID=UPI0008144E34|nr:mucin-5AC isoform X1 [Pygocentrus nattereri]XP_037400706.1 mucin-5AC isoform X1 [Pygocentrus nattereri]